jgi:actin filament associated protein 1
MRKTIDNRLLLGSIVSIVATFFLLGNLAYAQETDTATTKANTDNVKTKSLKPSDLPTRTKAKIQNFKDKATDVMTNKKSDSKKKKLDSRETSDKKTKKPRALEVGDNVKEKRSDLTDKKNKKVDARKIQEKKDKKKLEKKEKRKKLSAKRKDRIKAYIERILNRFRTAIGRLEKLADRVDSRIVKLEEKGLDLSKAKQLLAEARIEVESAKSALGGLLVKTDTALGENEPKTAFVGVKEILNGAKQDIKDAHKKLVEAIRAVKASLPKDDDDTPEAVTN